MLVSPTPSLDKQEEGPRYAFIIAAVLWLSTFPTHRRHFRHTDVSIPLSVGCIVLLAALYRCIRYLRAHGVPMSGRPPVRGHQKGTHSSRGRRGVGFVGATRTSVHKRRHLETLEYCASVNHELEELTSLPRPAPALSLNIHWPPLAVILMIALAVILVLAILVLAAALLTRM